MCHFLPGDMCHNNIWKRIEELEVLKHNKHFSTCLDLFGSTSSNWCVPCFKLSLVPWWKIFSLWLVQISSMHWSPRRGFVIKRTNDSNHHFGCNFMCVPTSKCILTAKENFPKHHSWNLEAVGAKLRGHFFKRMQTSNIRNQGRFACVFAYLFWAFFYVIIESKF